MKTSDWITIRKQAATRRRRILFDNDGDDVFLAAEPTAESFLSVRCYGIENTHVDTYVYSTLSNFNSCVHDSRVAELCTRPDPFQFPRNHTQVLIDQGRDSLSLVIDFCRANNLEVFWSARMNDMHDHWEPRMMTSFRKDHPELRLWRDGDYGRPGDGTIEPHMYAVAMDYGREEIRRRQFDTIVDVAERYDVDGIESDFLREPIFFRPNMEGRAVEAEHLDLMTAFVQHIRETIDKIGQKRGKPILLSVRVPNLIERCRYIGLDLARWIEEGLIDMVIPSIEFIPFTGDIREIVALAHSKNVPAYACIGGGVGGVGCWAAAATNALAGGADGIATYNNFSPTFPAWKIIGDPAALLQADKTYAVDHFRGVMSTHEHVIDRRRLLPIKLNPDAATDAYLPIYEDLTRRTKPTDLTIEATIEGCAFGDRIELRLNGTLLHVEKRVTTQGIAPRAVGTITFMADVDASSIMCGDNRVSIVLTAIEPRDVTPVLSDLRLHVHKRPEPKAGGTG